MGGGGSAPHRAPPLLFGVPPPWGPTAVLGSPHADPFGCHHHFRAPPFRPTFGVSSRGSILGSRHHFRIPHPRPPLGVSSYGPTQGPAAILGSLIRTHFWGLPTWIHLRSRPHFRTPPPPLHLVPPILGPPHSDPHPFRSPPPPFKPPPPSRRVPFWGPPPSPCSPGGRPSTGTLTVLRSSLLLHGSPRRSRMSRG